MGRFLVLGVWDSVNNRNNEFELRQNLDFSKLKEAIGPKLRNLSDLVSD